MTIIDTTTPYVFCGALAIDGTPVNAKRTTSKREIMSRLADEDGGYYALVSPHQLPAAWRTDLVYVWRPSSSL